MSNGTDDDMSNSREPWESEMSSEFDRRVRDLHEAPLTIDHVRGRAVNIQRKRRAVVAGSLLAAAAVIVPVAVAAANGLGSDRADEPGFADTPSTTATDTPTAPPVEPAPAPVADVAYLEGARYHRADGSVDELPAATYQVAAPLGDDVVAYRWDTSGDFGVVDVLEDGEVARSYEATFPFETSDEGVVAFVTTDGAVQTLSPDGSERVLAEGYDGWYPTVVLGGPACADPETGGSGCRVLLEDGNGQGDPTSVDSHGIQDVAAVGTVGINDADGAGRLSVLTSIEDGGSCGGVLDEDTGETLFEQCDFTVKTFSPDGRFVSGNEAYEDGIGTGFAVVLDAETGEERGRLKPDGGFINRVVWVDDDTIAASMFDYDDQTWSVRALTVREDEPETLLGPVAGTMDEVPFVLLDR